MKKNLRLNRLLAVFMAILLFATQFAYAKTSVLRVSGEVKTASGEPLAGVSVQIKGTTTGTSTDGYGKFILDVPSASSVLTFSFIGYLPQEITVGTKSIINVSMVEDDKALAELVVVGYGTQEKVNLTGSVGLASAERLQNRAIANSGEGLQGVIPNLNVTVTNGDPAASTQFNIRGYESINGGSPLILVDNVPMDINRINPNDIKSVTVLKDASAAAVYGARAAFGVILVETKQGTKGKINVNFSTQMSLAKPIFNMDQETDPIAFANARNIANIRTTGAPAYDTDYMNRLQARATDPSLSDWEVINGRLEFFGNNNYQNNIMTDYAPTSQHDLSISGGAEKSTYYVSLGAFSKDGYLKPAGKNEKFTRYNILMKADFKVKPWLTLNEKIVVNQQNSDKPHFYNWDVNINSLARVSTTMPIQFPDLPYYIQPGDRETYAPYIGKYFGGTNFFPYLIDGGRTTFTKNDVWLTQGAELTPINGLKIIGNFSYNLFNQEAKDVQSKVDIVDQDLKAASPISNGFSGDDWIRNDFYTNTYSVINTYAEYTFPMLTKHNLKAMVGYNQETGNYKYTGAQARSLITPTIPNINATTGTQQTFGAEEEFALRGAFYRLNYIYNNKYLLELNGRYDGSSRFPQDTRFGFFPSVSAGWKISEESFMKDIKWITNLKVRASYGTLGNQILKRGDNQIYYPYIAPLGTGFSNYMFTDKLIPFVSAPGLVSPGLTWETVISKNIGLDFALLNNKLDASFDVFTRDTKKMLMDVQYPDLLGTTAPKQNAADLRTKGWELALNWRDKINKDWKYNLTLALADATSEITKFENPTGAIDGTYHVGQKLGEIWGFETVGIFQSDDEVKAAPSQTRFGNSWKAGDIQYRDLNGDGKIDLGSNTITNPGDRRVIGNSTARYSFGINTGISYKNFNLTAFFQGVAKRDFNPSSGSWTWFYPFNAGHVEKYYITDSWSESNRDAYFFAPYLANADTGKKNLQTQTRYLQNAAFIRLKNIMLSYDLPSTLTKKIGLERVQVFTSGMNLWEFSKIRKPLDPETIFATAIEYPMQRIVTGGINISL